MEKTLVWQWLNCFAQRVLTHHEFLTDLDRQIGDADHGSNLKRGVEAILALDPDSFPDAAALLKKAGMTLVSTVGGASGPLYGTFFLRFAPHAVNPDPVIGFEQGLAAGIDGIKARGRSEAGEKTMLDTLCPCLATFQTTTGDFQAKLAAAQKAAEEGMKSTVPMIATKGRASYLGERSKGVQDPGATSACFLMAAATQAFGSKQDE